MTPPFRASALALLLFAGIAQGAQAQSADAPRILSFTELWQEIDRHSPAQKGAEAGIEAARAAKTRWSRYAQPQVYATGRVFNTNDPGTLFISRLGQRAVDAKDFAPSNLNQPDPAVITQGGVGVALPLYEGGQGAARTAAAGEALYAAEHDRLATRQQQYAETFGAYGSILALWRASARLEPIARQVEEVVSAYELGRTSNPVGYSGLLALQTVANRIRIAGGEFEAQARGSTGALSTLADLEGAQWRIEILELDDFLARFGASTAGRADSTAGEGASSGGSTESFRIRSIRARAASTFFQAQTELSIFRPKVGLFAEGNAIAGDRGTGTSYSAGAYLTWALSMPTAKGAAEEARLQSLALEQQANAAALEDRIAVREAQAAIAAARGTLALLRKNAELLDEQDKTTRRLFDNGTITAAQLADLFSKRVDHHQAVVQNELALVNGYRTLIQHRPEAPHGF